MNGFVNKMLGAILCVFMILIMICNAIITEQLQARRSIIAEVTNFIDELTDTGYLDERRVADLYLGCSAYGPTVDVQIFRQTRVVNPDPDSPGDTHTTYISSDNIYEWSKGDLVRVTVKEVSPAPLVSLLYRQFGLGLGPVDFSLAGRVRV